MIDTKSGKPILLFGGPYSNVRALHALRAVADQLAIGPDRVLCTGDVVAYGGEPEETIAAIRDWGINVIAGNCDENVALGSADCGCGFAEGSVCDLLARGWYPFANSSVSDASRDWLARLPRTLAFELEGFRVRVVHGTPATINAFVFASEPDRLEAEIAAAGADIVLAGHCGLPFISRLQNGVWFNPGVIGLPANDGTRSTWYGLIEPEAGGLRLALRRLSYDHSAAAGSMRRTGHANGYARTLITGLWPSLDILPPAERAATGQRIRQTSLRVGRRQPARRVA